MGINLFFYKLLAFFIGCFLAGIAGSLMAHSVGLITMDNFPFMDSVLYVGIIIIGGLGTTLGPISGVILIRLLGVGVLFLSPALKSWLPGLPGGFYQWHSPYAFWINYYPVPDTGTARYCPQVDLFKASYRLWPFSY